MNCFDALEQLDERAKAYIRDFGLRANFRAALHCGPVAIGELGTIKMEIAFLGDTMNTAARLQQACRDTGQRVLASAALVNRLAALPPGIAKRSIGQLRLRGKENEIELYALTAAVSATSASGEITALSSRLGFGYSPCEGVTSAGLPWVVCHERRVSIRGAQLYER